MFGIYRYILAIMVVVPHLAPLPRQNHSGIYAVFSFYMLSGYLMTLILNENYGFNFKGITRYLSNRALRIYPPYLVVLFFSIVVLLMVPGASGWGNASFAMPAAGVTGWVNNLTFAGLYMDTPRPVMSAWSLYVEVVFYVLMCVLLSRHRIVVFVWAALSVLYTAYLLYKSPSYEARYYPVLAASLPFSIGAAIYYIRQWWTPDKRVLQAAVVLFFFNLLLWFFYRRGDVLSGLILGFYINIAISAVLILCLTGRRDDRVGRFLGDLSYPLFLCHWQVGAVVAWLVAVPERGALLMLLSLAPSHLFAYLVHVAVEKRLSRIRDRIRAANADKAGLSDGRVAPESTYKQSVP